MPKTNRKKITQRMIDTLKDVEKETWLHDSEVLGLGIRMRPGSSPVWAIRYKLPSTGQDRKATLWPVDTITLEDARKIARTKIGEIARTGGVVDTRLEAKYRETVKDLAKRIAEEMEEKDKAPSYVAAFRQQCQDYIEPSIGDTLVRDVSKSDVDRLLVKLRKTPFLHNRVRAVLSKLFNVARRDGLRVDNPAFGSEKASEEARQRTLDDAEVGRLLLALDANPGMEADAFRLLYLTGSRPKELLSAQWKDFALPDDASEPAVWTKPALTVKQRRTHRVDLSALAAATLRKRLEDEKGLAKKRKEDAPGADDYVFPSRKRNGTHLSDTRDYWAKVTKEAGLKDVRRYDLRKSFATRILAAGTDIKTAMSLTGHTQVAIFLKHYAQLVKGAQSKALGAVDWTPGAKAEGNAGGQEHDNG